MPAVQDPFEGRGHFRLFLWTIALQLHPQSWWVAVLSGHPRYLWSGYPCHYQSDPRKWLNAGEIGSAREHTFSKLGNWWPEPPEPGSRGLEKGEGSLCARGRVEKTGSCLGRGLRYEEQHHQAQQLPLCTLWISQIQTSARATHHSGIAAWQT